jgi:uncharacterized ion transporter superfamily protein YfcC
MHFVKKEPTTDEQKEQKRKEREKKLKIYSAARDRLFEKRQKGAILFIVLLLVTVMCYQVFFFWRWQEEMG